MRTLRSTLAIVFLAGAAMASLGVNSVAAESLAKPWTESECKTVGGQWANNDCYAKQAPVDLSVSVGGLSKATLSQYLAAAFNLGVGIAAVLATLFIMIGGFRYIYAAGGGDVDAAKGMIRNAIIGLVLTALSYTLLQTVNPALVSLQLPPIKLLKSVYLNQLATKGNITVGGPCYTIQDKAACAQACVDRGLTDTSCECTVVDPGLWSKFATVSTAIATIAVGGQVGGYKLAGEGLKSVGNTGLNLASRLWTYAKTNPFSFAGNAVKGGAVVTTGGFLAAAGYAILPSAPDKGEEGVCLPMALATIQPGGTCFEDKNCTTGKCTIINNNPTYGMCVSGAEGTACSNDNPTFMVNDKPSSCASSDLQCCVVSYGLGTCQKSCTSGKPLDSLCADNSECQSGYCSLNVEKAAKVCEKGSTGAYCGDTSGCSPGHVCKTPFYVKGASFDLQAYRQQFNTCQTKGRTGDPCCDNSECITDSCNRSTTGQCQITILSGQISYGSAGACN